MPAWQGPIARIRDSVVYLGRREAAVQTSPKSGIAAKPSCQSQGATHPTSVIRQSGAGRCTAAPARGFLQPEYGQLPSPNRTAGANSEHLVDLNQRLAGRTIRPRNLHRIGGTAVQGHEEGSVT